MKSSCRPPRGSTYLTIGQDLFSIQQYVNEQYNASLHNLSVAPMSSFYPAAVMSYTDLETLRGLEKPVDYGSGVEYADGVLESLFPGYDVGIQIGLWLDGADGCRKINRGEMDGRIEELTHFLQRCRASKVFLRIGYEFDNPYFGYSGDPGGYAAAFRRIVDVCQAKLTEKRLSEVQFVWHSWAAPAWGGIELDEFFPGDEYVDWIGVSIFQQPYPWASPWDGGPDDVERVMSFASRHGKPTMIAESTPFGGIDLDTDETRELHLEDPWDRWFKPVLDLIDRYDISMWCYINCAWDQQPMWHNVGFGETRLSTSDATMRKWRDLVVGSSGGNDDGSRRRFWMAGSLGDCGEQGDDNARLSAAEGGAPSGHDGEAAALHISSSSSLKSAAAGGSGFLMDAGVIVAGAAIFILAMVLSLGRCRRVRAVGSSASRRVRFREDIVHEKSPMLLSDKQAVESPQ